MIDQTKSSRNPALKVFLCLGLLGVSCLTVYNTLSVRSIAEDAANAYQTWRENRFVGARASLQGLLMRIDSCLTEAKRKSEMYRDLGMECVLAAKASDQITYQDAILCLDKALPFTDDDYGRISIYRDQALSNSLSGRYDTAEKLYTRSVQMSRQLSGSQQKLLIYALSGQGTNFAAENKFKLAEDALNEALLLANSRNDSSVQPRLLYELGRVAEKTGDLKKAHDFYTRALKTEKTAMSQLDRVGLMTLVHDESVLQQLGKKKEAQELPKQLDEGLN